MTINSRFKTFLTGYYNKSVDICPYCGNKMGSRIFENCIGFSNDVYSEPVMIVECDKCFGKFYFHSDIPTYKCFLSTVDEGKNIFFKKTTTP